MTCLTRVLASSGDGRHLSPTVEPGKLEPSHSVARRESLDRPCGRAAWVFTVMTDIAAEPSPLEGGTFRSVAEALSPWT